MDTNRNEDDLKRFLQRNQPQPPPGPENELALLLAKTAGVKNTPVRRPLWPRAVAAVAAALAIAILTREAVREAPYAPPFAALEEPDMLEPALPALEVGESYLELAALSEE